MRIALFALLLLLPVEGLAGEVRVSVGMGREEAIALIKKHGGRDITAGIAVVGPHGEWPLSEIYWRFDRYDAVISLSNRNGKVTAMSYWTKKDFDESKSHRAETEQSITALKLDPNAGAVSIERPNPAKSAG